MAPIAVDQVVTSSKSTYSEFRRPSKSQAAADCIPLLVDNEYHLFHLTTPHDTTVHPPRLRSTWSHLRSKDLIEWTRDDLPALKPGDCKEDPDADGIWTGAALLGPQGNMHIFYTGYNLSKGGQQTIMHATSKDRHGTSFVKAKADLAITGNSHFEDIDFRDAYLFFNESDRKYWMLVATRLAQGPFWTRGCIALLTSTDLENWSLDSKPLVAPNDIFCPECPELFQLPNGKWYLIYSRFSGPDPGTIWKVADSPRGPFRTPRDGSGGRFDGRRWYAAKSCPKANDPSTRVFFGWTADQMSDGQWLWGGDLCHPREVYADDRGNLRIRAVGSIVRKMYGPASAEQTRLLTIESIGTKVSQVISEQPPGGGYLLEFRVGLLNAASFGVNLRMNQDGKGLALRFVPTLGGSVRVALTRFPVPLDDFWADQYQLYLPREVDGVDAVTHDVILKSPVSVFVNGDCVETFVEGKALTYRYREPSESGFIEPHADRNGNDTSNEFSFFVCDGVVSLEDISILYRRT